MVLHATTTSDLTRQLPTGLLALLPTFGSEAEVYILEGLEGGSDPWLQHNSPRPSLTNQFNHMIASSLQWPLPPALQFAKQLLFPSGASLHGPSPTGSTASGPPTWRLTVSLCTSQHRDQRPGRPRGPEVSTNIC